MSFWEFLYLGYRKIIECQCLILAHKIRLKLGIREKLDVLGKSHDREGSGQRFTGHGDLQDAAWEVRCATWQSCGESGLGV